MSNFDSIKNNVDQIISDVKVQIASIQNDIKILPETVEQIAANSQVLLGQARMQIEAVSDDLLKGKLFKKDYKPEIQRVVTELQTSVIKMLDSIKNAIEKAK
ncbi:MAG TPA: hypothetical protein VLZ75_14340 [Chitinophagales bacterium]|nr:hypothetical protein [Chitinophagales bacterium]